MRTDGKEGSVKERRKVLRRDGNGGGVEENKALK